MANDFIKVDPAGIKEAAKGLEDLGPSSQKRVVRGASTKAATPMNKKAKALAPVETGLLKKSIGKTRAKTYGPNVVVTVGPRKGFRTERTELTTKKKPGFPGEVGDYGEGTDRKTYPSSRSKWHDPVNIAHLVEFGTKHSRAKPFLRPATKQAFPDSMRIMEQEIATGIPKEAEKELAKATAKANAARGK